MPTKSKIVPKVNLNSNLNQQQISTSMSHYSLVINYNYYNDMFIIITDAAHCSLANEINEENERKGQSE